MEETFDKELVKKKYPLAFQGRREYGRLQGIDSAVQSSVCIFIRCRKQY